MGWGIDLLTTYVSPEFPAHRCDRYECATPHLYKRKCKAFSLGSIINSGVAAVLNFAAFESVLSERSPSGWYFLTG